MEFYLTIFDQTLGSEDAENLFVLSPNMRVDHLVAGKAALTVIEVGRNFRTVLWKDKPIYLLKVLPNDSQVEGTIEMIKRNSEFVTFLQQRPNVRGGGVGMDTIRRVATNNGISLFKNLRAKSRAELLADIVFMNDKALFDLVKEI